MNQYSEFEAQLKSGIQADADWIKKYDEVIKDMGKIYNKCLAVGLLFLAAAAHAFFWNKIVMAVLLIPALLLLFLFTRKPRWTKEERKEVYEEGLLVPGMIVKTNPLTVMAIANLSASDEDIPARYGIYNLKVKKLVGAKGQLYEKIPCSCFFRYEGGDYHVSFQPHPLFWGTRDLQDIARALSVLEEENYDNETDEWEVIKKTAAEFPNLKDGEIVLLDENYKPFGKLDFMDENYAPLNEEDADEMLRKKYPKKTQDAPLIEKDIPGKEIYNKMIQLACRHKVYEYISKPADGKKDKIPAFNTYLCDPMEFLQELQRKDILLSQGEYPLLKDYYLITTKGCHLKKKFVPWSDMEIKVKPNMVQYIKTTVNGTCVADFASQTVGYENAEQMTEEEKVKIAKWESERIAAFLAELKGLTS